MNEQTNRRRGQVYSYSLGRKLYLNLTNRCTNNCEFCVRRSADGVGEDNLWLNCEPSVREVLESIAEPTGWEEIVFCGFGEPLTRVDTVVEIAKALRPYGVPLRINTNGQANLIHGRNVVPELAGLIDTISISLNAESPEQYQELCHSVYGEQAFEAVLQFARACCGVIPRVVLSVVDRPGVNISACKKIAAELNVEFRVRHWQPGL